MISFDIIFFMYFCILNAKIRKFQIHTPIVNKIYCKYLIINKINDCFTLLKTYNSEIKHVANPILGKAHLSIYKDF